LVFPIEFEPANGDVNDLFVDQRLLPTHGTTVEILLRWRPKGDVDALSWWGRVRVVVHSDLA
jgi:hypothetical protein